ncbi:MAG: alpha/beta hydrolase [Bacteroidales bacterium]|nr:alpha/beta hydrolase [Bacteroidales bacterium]
MADKHLFKSDTELSGFESLTINQPDDYEGAVVCTLIKKKSVSESDTAVLHVHGFNDYFFHNEAAIVFAERGIHFYAVDMRKSGRSYLPHQKFNNLRSLDEYFEDIKVSLETIKNDGIKKIVLMGHSLGGLTVALFAEKYSDSGLFDAVFLNSPFFEQNEDIVTKKILIPIVSTLAKHWPDFPVPGGFSKFYGPSLHKNFKGEWDYNLNWKPHVAPLVNSGWVRAVYLSHQKIKQGIKLKKPTLLAYAEKSIKRFSWSEEFHTCDAVVNVKDTKKYAKNLLGDIEVLEIHDAKHDLFLSQKYVREKFYDVLFLWIDKTLAKSQLIEQ